MLTSWVAKQNLFSLEMIWENSVVCVCVCFLFTKKAISAHTTDRQGSMFFSRVNLGTCTGFP